MLRKLEIDALKADLAAVDAVLRSKSEADDPIGVFQFKRRKEELQRELSTLVDSADLSAAVGVFFGGRPAMGSKGIMADFAGKAINAFDDIVSKQLALEHLGDLGARGPIPLSSEAHLMITDVARGSFGFVLEEAAANQSLAETSLKVAVDKASKLLSAVASEDEGTYEEAVDVLSERLLISLKQFFQVLDENGATLRVVEADEERVFDSQAIHRARVRTQTTEIRERDTDEISGVLIGLLPEHRRFELRRLDTGETISGWITPEYSKRALQQVLTSNEPILGQVWRCRVRIREVIERNRKPRLSFTLLGLLERERFKGA